MVLLNPYLQAARTIDFSNDLLERFVSPFCITCGAQGIDIPGALSCKLGLYA